LNLGRAYLKTSLLNLMLKGKLRDAERHELEPQLQLRVEEEALSPLQIKHLLSLAIEGS